MAHPLPLPEGRECVPTKGRLRRTASPRCEPDGHSHQDRHGHDRQPHLESVVGGARTWVAWTRRAVRDAWDHRDRDHDSDDKGGCDQRPSETAHATTLGHRSGQALGAGAREASVRRGGRHRSLRPAMFFVHALPAPPIRGQRRPGLVRSLRSPAHSVLAGRREGRRPSRTRSSRSSAS